MHTSKAKYINELLDTENDHLKKMNEIVLQSIEQEKLLLQNISQPQEEQLSLGQRLADRCSTIRWQLEIHHLVCSHIMYLDNH